MVVLSLIVVSGLLLALIAMRPKTVQRVPLVNTLVGLDALPAAETREQLKARYYKSDGDGQRRIARSLRKECERLGHDLGDIQPVFSSGGQKGADELGNRIAYHMRHCKRCGLRQPVGEDDARYKAAMDASTLRLFRQYHPNMTKLPENFEGPF